MQNGREKSTSYWWRRLHRLSPVHEISKLTDNLTIYDDLSSGKMENVKDVPTPNSSKATS